MDNSKLLDRLTLMEAHLNILQESVTALRQELEGSDAPSSPARKGKKDALDPAQKARILARREINRNKKK